MLMFDVYPHTLCRVSLIFLHVTLHFLLTHHHLCQKMNCPETGFCVLQSCLGWHLQFLYTLHKWGQNDISEYFFSVSFHSPFTGANIHTTSPFPIHCTLSILSPVNISTQWISTVKIILFYRVMGSFKRLVILIKRILIHEKNYALGTIINSLA